MRWVIRILAIVVLIVGAAIVTLILIPSERIAGLVAEQISAATGRDIQILGEVQPSLWPEIGAQVGQVELLDADGEVLLSAGSVSVGVDLMALVSGDVRIKGIEIARAELNLERGQDGTGNWETPTSDDADGSPVPAFSLDRLAVVGGAISYTGPDGAETRLENLALSASLPDFYGPLDASFEADLGAMAVTGELSLADAAGFFGGGRTPVAADLNSGSNNLKFSGSATMDGIVDGEFALSMPSPGDVPALADLPRGLGADRIEARGGLALADGEIALAGLTASLDDNRLSGSAEIAFGDPRPKVMADLSLGDFDLSALATPADEGNSQTGWSTDPIDVSFLDAFDGTIRLSADSLALGTARLDQTILRTVIDDSRSVTRFERMVAYDGAIGGEVILNGRGVFSTRVDVAGSALAISRLLSELVGYDRLVAAGNLQLNVLGSGPHMSAVMNSLDGQGAFDVGAGELIGLDIVAMLTNLDPSLIGENRRTIFDSITVSFQVVDGVIIYDDLIVAAPLFRASGTGQIGLGGQTLDLRLLPELLGGKREGIAVPLTIKGTWDSPRIGLDVENMIRRGIESEVGERLQNEAAERLGVTVEEGQSVEDAVRDRLQDELQRGLGGLFGGD